MARCIVPSVRAAVGLLWQLRNQVERFEEIYRRINSMNKTLIAKAAVTVNAPTSKIWEAITNPEFIKQYLFGADVITDWKEGSPIHYKGIYQGKAYEDKGVVLKVEPEKLLLITHWSPLSGSTDSPENYHQVRYDLALKRATPILQLLKIITPRKKNRNKIQISGKRRLMA